MSCKRISKQILSVLFLLLLASSVSIAREKFSNSAKMIDSYFKRLESFGLSGSLLIGDKNRVLFKENYGIKNSRKDFDYAYSVGSVTKQFTASAILLLEQRGLLNTNDKISAHLTGVPEDKSDITIHQLLTHTSGLMDGYWDRNRNLSEEQYIKKILAGKLDSAPGSRHSYVNPGYHLLKKIIEIVSNKSYEKFLVEDIFKPNNLNRTGFRLVKWNKDQVVKYSDWTMSESKIKDLAYPLKRPVYLQPEGSGGLLSTTNDLYKWYQLIFNSNKLLTTNSKTKLLKTEKNNYAYGWNVTETSRNTKLISHGAYDSWLGTVTGFYNFADEDLVVIFLGNTNMSQFLRKEDLMRDIETIVFGGSVELPPESSHKASQRELDLVLGSYGRNGKTTNIAKGKIDNQIRLRTKDQNLIKHLLFPKLSESKKLTDFQLEFFVDQINKNDFAPLKGTYLRSATFEGAKAQYSGVWKNLVSNYGKYKELRVLHMLPSTYEGKFELQFFTEFIFEKGSFYARMFRFTDGSVQVQPLSFPKKLEIYLIPKNKNEFITWNIKTGTSSTIQINGNELVVNGNDQMTFLKQ
ncbi:MAG: beta-lactamase family protein [Pyrinomonadaceae bacterium]|nr:beta-lactamase family protein [Pyrinomonadaceae bacterium]